MHRCPSARESSWSGRWREELLGWGRGSGEAWSCRALTPAGCSGHARGSAEPLTPAGCSGHARGRWLPEARHIPQSHRSQRTTSMCPTWAKCLRSMCRPTCPTCRAWPTTSCTVRISAPALPRRPLAPFQSCLPSTRRWLSLSSPVSRELGTDLGGSTPAWPLSSAGTFSRFSHLEDGVLAVPPPPPPPPPAPALLVSALPPPPPAQTVAPLGQPAREDDSGGVSPSGSSGTGPAGRGGGSASSEGAPHLWVPEGFSVA